jgi:hypothetical protein
MSSNAGVGAGGVAGLSQWVRLYTGPQINFADLPPYLTYALNGLKAAGKVLIQFSVFTCVIAVVDLGVHFETDPDLSLNPTPQKLKDKQFFGDSPF